MNQTRTFLIVAWFMVATLLWMEWSKERSAPATTPAQATTTGAPPATGSIPAAPRAMTPGAAAAGAVPAAPAVPLAGAMPQASAGPATDAGSVSVTTDVLRLSLSGGAVTDAELLGYPRTKDAGSPPVKLFDSDPATFYAAQSGWVSGSNAAPTHESGFVYDGAPGALALAQGQDQLVVPFIWRGDDGVTIRRSYTLARGSYAITVRDTVANAGASEWQGFAYRQLIRVPPVVKRGMTNPESFSFSGATWFSSQEGYERRAFGDFVDDGPLDRQAGGAWLAFLQHHFFSAWIPDNVDTSTISVGADGTAGRFFIRAVGPGISVAPGTEAATTARIWVGPKLVGQIKAQDVPGLDRAVDYSRFSIFAFLGEGLFWILDLVHGLVNNWGWAIVGLVVLVKLALFPLSSAQYKSMARMRKFQPRVAQLKERYGDDRQKFQVAMMELYKKEKINPVGGCLPLLLQMPIFLALYWVLLESVELRHAPWILWIQDLTAQDPYYILPVINIAVMWATQKLSPMTGMDPMQQKMMQFMPIVFGAIMIFFPAGLVLYWVTNGTLGLLQQWLLIRKYAEAPATPA